MTGFMDLVRERRSVRSYSPRPVERERLEELAEALRLAPSASNQQPWRIVFVDDPRRKDEVARATFGGAVNFNRFAVGAPVLAVVTIEPPRLLNRVGAALQGREYPLIDIGLGVAHLALRATELGLGTCILGWFDEAKVKKIIGAPRSRRVALVLTIGYPAESSATPAASKPRKPIEEVRGFNEY